MNEEILLLGPHASIVGVHTPAAPGAQQDAPKLAVVMLNSGLIHHAGPHRLYVKLARALAAQGIGAVRIDLSGIGDSPARPDNLPAAELGFREPREIIDSLRTRGYEEFVLLGICSGARHALQAVSGGARVTGLVLVNQEALSDAAPDSVAAQATAQFYLRRSVWNPRAWLNLVTGKVKYRALFSSLARELRRRLGSARRRQATLAELFGKELEPALAGNCNVLLMLSDRHAQYVALFDEGVRDLESLGQVRVALRAGADHLFTSRDDQAFFIDTVCAWARACRQALAVSRHDAAAPARQAFAGE